jgi:hypothetical protein
MPEANHVWVKLADLALQQPGIQKFDHNFFGKELCPMTVMQPANDWIFFIAC